MWTALALGLVFAAQTADYNAAGMQALEARKFEEAAQQFAKAVEADPKDYGSLFHLALANSLLGKSPEAIDGYRKVLELKPGLFEAQLNLGVLLLEERRVEEALPLLEAAADARPAEFRPNFFLAEALAESNPEKAAAFYEVALRLDSKSARAVLGMGRCQAKLGRMEQAIDYYRKAAEFDASLKEAQLELAQLLEQRKMFPEAIALYRQFPENAGASERAGELLLESGDAAGAQGLLERAVELSPTSANRFALAVAYLRNGQREKAVTALQAAISADPGNFELHMALGRVLRDQKNPSSAAAEFLRAAQLKPDSQECWTELAGMFALLEKYPEALAALDRAKAAGPEIPGHLFLRAIILDKNKQYKEALANYERFLAISGGKFADQEFQARQRIRALQKILERS